MKKLLGLGLVGLLGLGAVNSQAADRNVFNVTVDNFKYQYNGNTNSCISWNFDYRKEFIWFVREGSWVVYKAPAKWKEGEIMMVDAINPATKEEVTMIFATTQAACEEAIKVLNKK